MYDLKELMALSKVDRKTWIVQAIIVAALLGGYWAHYFITLT